MKADTNQFFANMSKKWVCDLLSANYEENIGVPFTIRNTPKFWEM